MGSRDRDESPVRRAPLPAEKLLNDGVVVLPTGLDVAAARQMVIGDVANFPEFQGQPERWVMGGFSALGNPASFHCQSVRLLRQWAMHSVVPLFNEVLQRQGRADHLLEQCPDRLMVRPAGAMPSAESWHRDETPGVENDESVYGGWWNLGPHDQYFSCVLGTHLDAPQGGGFARIQGDEARAYSQRKTLVKIPPGHIIVFYEHIVHEVLARKASVPTYRLFLGWRTTPRTQPLNPVDQVIAQQGVFQLKSGQTPPMYALLHWTNWRPRVVDFSRYLQPQCLEVRTVRSGEQSGQSFSVVERCMRSLTAYQLPLYPAYSRAEVDLLKPARTWSVLPVDERDGNVVEIKL